MSKVIAPDEEIIAPAHNRNKKRGKPQRSLALIQKRYQIKKQSRKLTSEDGHIRQQKYTAHVLPEIRGYLDNILPQVPSGSSLGKVLNYLNNKWNRRAACLDETYLKCLYTGIQKVKNSEGLQNIVTGQVENEQIKFG